MATHRCAGGLKSDLRSGSLGTSLTFRRVRPSTDTGPTFLYGYSEKPPHLVAFYDTLRIRRTHSIKGVKELTAGEIQCTGERENLAFSPFIHLPHGRGLNRGVQYIVHVI